MTSYLTSIVKMTREAGVHAIFLSPDRWMAVREELVQTLARWGNHQPPFILKDYDPPHFLLRGIPIVCC